MEKVNYSTRPPNPKEKAGFLSSIFFWWTFGVIRKGHKIRYEVENLPSPLQTDQSQVLANKLEKQWQREVDLSKIRGTKPSLLRSLTKTFYTEFIKTILLEVVHDLILAVGQQLLLGLFLVLLRDIRSSESSYNNLIYVGIILVIFYVLKPIFHNHFINKCNHLGFRIQTALTSLVYRKPIIFIFGYSVTIWKIFNECLRLGNNVGENTSAGKVVNLISNDMRQFNGIIIFMNYTWSGICLLIITLVILVHIVGILPTLACLAFVLLMLPLQMALSKLLASNRIKMARASDKRIQTMDEIICGIQIIKMYAWERPFEELIQKLRGSELKFIRKFIVIVGLQISSALVLWLMARYILITVYAALGGDMLPEPIFVALGYCSLLANTVCISSLKSLGEISQAYVSIKRLQHFLELEEFKKPNIQVTNSREYAIRFSKVKANWTVDSSRNTIHDLNLSIKKHELTTIIGQVGSGKTSLLSVILGELPISDGKISVSGTVSYYCQVPWIFAGTIRENILLGQDFEQSRYDRVIKACALDVDLKAAPNGDHTLIGERGITLSGGQKARVTLARAIYRRADIYLLDDPLSAVDASVGKYVFERCLLGFLKDKTRVLVTHQQQFLHNSDRVILLHEGILSVEGKYEEIMNSQADHLNMLKNVYFHSKNETGKNVSSLIGSQEDIQDQSDFEMDDRKELEKEDNEKSSSQALIRYIYNGIGIKGFLAIFILCIVTQVSINTSEIWIAIWTHYTASVLYNSLETENWWILPDPNSKNGIFMIVYTAIVIGAILLIMMRNHFFVVGGFHCSKKIHNMSFKGVLRTHSSFFHNNPSGRILNRFSKDLGGADLALTLSLLDAVTCTLQALSSILISTSANPIYMIPAVMAFIGLYLMRRIYLKTTVTMKRLESITNSPVLVHVHTTLQGLTTIRANSAADKLIEQFHEYQDTHTAAWYFYYMSQSSFRYYSETICILYMTTIVIGSFFLNLSGSEVGLALMQISIILDYISWAMVQTAEVTNQITSVDRLMRYSSLPAEPQPEKEQDSKITDWPSRGKITFNDVSLKYNLESESSIHNVSFNVLPMEKVGIVGRTGAGKTSLLAALFRLGHVSGTIMIDGRDTSSVHLEKLRSSISIIPQDPVLFSGSIRKNLDPFGEYSDAALWDALDQAELKQTISEKEAGLNYEVSEGGKNFSVGQRQLICLARAILRSNKILVLDEATANVDQQTDCIIQKTIKEKLRTCTVLTVAHRLNTIIDSDVILVMDGGTLVEMGHPHELLSKQKSHFKQLVSKTGTTMSAILQDIARKNFNDRHKNSEAGK